MRLGRRLGALLLVAAVCVAQARENEPQTPLIGRVVAALCSSEDTAKTLDVVVSHIANVPGEHRMNAKIASRVKRALAEPWSGLDLAQELKDDLATIGAKPKQVALTPAIDAAAKWLDVSEKDEDEDVAKQVAELSDVLERDWSKVADPLVVDADLLAATSKLMEDANRLVALAYGDWDEDDRARATPLVAAALDCWFRCNSPKPEVSDQQAKDLSAGLALVRRVDMRPLVATLRVLCRFAEPEFVNTFGPRLANLANTAKAKKSGVALDGVTGDVITIVGDKPENRVVLGGPAKTTYTGGAAALVLDLGGDDAWTRAAVVDATGDGKSPLVSVVVDLKGNDRYESCASAAGGVAVLVDRGGNDEYVSHRFAQGAAAGGAALLVDLAGNDKFEMEDYGQGFGFGGIGLLVDAEGDDKRTMWAFGQGSTLTTGFGALVDVAGDDQDTADLHWPDVYGDSGPNVYHGASQGYTTGIRADAGAPWPDTPGGTAAFIDLAGKNRFQSGNFSMGGAYFFGFALMYSGPGDDQNFGTRYSQGFGVHQAVGVRWDAGGNDQYHTRVAANLGAAWDESVGFLRDDGGDDVYDQQGGLAIGSAAETGIGMLIDGGGKDTYTGGGADCQGGVGATDYHNKPSLGVLIDLGGGADTYSRKEDANGVKRVEPSGAVFIDSPKKTLAELATKG